MFYGVILSLKIQRKASDTMSDIRADIEENIESSQEKYEDLKPELSSKIESGGELDIQKLVSLNLGNYRRKTIGLVKNHGVMT